MIVIQRRFSDVIIRETEISPTLEAGGGEGGNNMPMILITLNDQGGGVMNWNYDEMTATLRAGMGSHPPMVCVANFTTGSQIAVGGVREARHSCPEITRTLNA